MDIVTTRKMVVNYYLIFSLERQLQRIINMVSCFQRGPIYLDTYVFDECNNVGIINSIEIL